MLSINETNSWSGSTAFVTRDFGNRDSPDSSPPLSLGASRLRPSKGYDIPSCLCVALVTGPFLHSCIHESVQWESANNPLNNVDRWIESHRLETWHAWQVRGATTINPEGQVHSLSITLSSFGHFVSASSNGHRARGQGPCCV